MKGKLGNPFDSIAKKVDILKKKATVHKSKLIFEQQLTDDEKLRVECTEIQTDITKGESKAVDCDIEIIAAKAHKKDDSYYKAEDSYFKP